MLYVMPYHVYTRVAAVALQLTGRGEMPVLQLKT